MRLISRKGFIMIWLLLKGKLLDVYTHTFYQLL